MRLNCSVFSLGKVKQFIILEVVFKIPDSVLYLLVYNFEVLYFSISSFCYFIRPLHSMLEANIVLFTHYISLTTYDTGYLSDNMLH